ncbi:PREDICTED: probable cytochrome P450 6a14 [Dinoponera quadriceps]|uniref:Probable cytochrome P450 6a14 n=1 Tax=Dinoponera quadriceps TaxID=609295 RepID=A0A6P3WW92_DINQU|nr:PREDICTED: probable cytochrome P450 6a14 [Dinoponera quadriceps]
MGLFEILCGIAAAILVLYYYFTSTYNFWKSRGVQGPQPKPPFGNIKDILLVRKSTTEFLSELYHHYKDEPMIGVFARRTPVLILKDLDLIKDILIKDFTSFADRGFTTHKKTEPLSQHLFFLEPKRWRPLRTRLSPAFTSGKLKDMFSLILECANHMERYIDTLVSKNEPVEFRELTAKFTTDVIGSCAFGIDTNSLSDNDSEFRKMGRQVFAPSWNNIVRIRLRQSVPWFYDMLGYVLPRTQITKFFTRIVMESIDYREKNNVSRPDIVDVLLEIKKYPEKLNIEVTDSLLTSQAFVFFIAGFETSSTTMSNALYELALDQKVQDKLRDEIRQEYAKVNDELTYDNIKKMSYLDKVFKETLRKYPPVTFIMRKATSDYTFSGTKVTIPKGIRVWIPAYAIQRDPDIYSEPDVFDPERFSEEAKQKRHPMTFLSFGDGPRNCIGSRFAVYQTKIGLIKMLRNYKVETCEKTQPYVIDPNTLLLAPKDGIYLKLTKVN